MNNEWAQQQLEKFIQMTVMHSASRPGSGTYKKITSAPDEEVVKQAHAVEKILDRVLPQWREQFRRGSSNRWTTHREAAIRAREALSRQQEISENLGDLGPSLSAHKLHPWVWDGAASLWKSGHFREAVEGGIRKLNAETQNKLGRRDISETDLFKQAFSTDAPELGRRRLRRMADDSSKTYKSVQRGAMAFAEGVFSGIRNPLSHEAEHDLSEQEALEYLAALSVLARWVDGASIEDSEEPAGEEPR